MIGASHRFNGTVGDIAILARLGSENKTVDALFARIMLGHKELKRAGQALE